MRIFTIVGIVLAVIGAYFAYLATQPSTGPFDVGHAAAPIVALTLLPMGIIFVIVGMYFSRLLGNRGELMREGIPGQARIESLAETGMLINNRPMVRMTLYVTVPGRAPYTLEHKEVVPLIALGMIAPGSTLPVVIDPTDPNRLAIDWSGETRARALGQAGYGAQGAGGYGAGGYGAPGTGGYGAGAPSAPGMPVPNTLSSTGGSIPNTITPEPVGGDPQAGVGFAMPPGMSMGVQPQPTFSMTGSGLDLSALYQQLAQAGITIGGGLPVMTSGSTRVIDARQGDQAGHLAMLKASGQLGRAVVRSSQDMNIAVHGSQIVVLDLEVTPQGGAAYPARVTAMVPQSDAGKVFVGAGLPVYADRANPQNLAVDWDAV